MEIDSDSKDANLLWNHIIGPLQYSGVELKQGGQIVAIPNRNQRVDRPIATQLVSRRVSHAALVQLKN